MGAADLQLQHASLLATGIATALVLASLIGRGLKITVAKRQPHEAIDNLNTRVNTWWVIAGVVGLALLAGRIGVTLLFAGASFVALREFAARPSVPQSESTLLTACLGLAVPLQYLFVAAGSYALYAAFIPVVALVALPIAARSIGDARDRAVDVRTLSWGLLSCVYCISHVPALLALELPGHEGGNGFMLVYLLLVVQSSDVLQYVWGKLAGRHALAPQLSPGKTVEGTIGGVASATLLGGLLYPITPFSLGQAMLVSFAITSLGVLGGLLMSAVKRRRGLKDWGTLIKGHGGMLDRLDSLCLSAPVYYYIVRFVTGG